ncbi:MAG: carbon-nitrogen hydrolase family protein, partial [Betaproteobacteria bacterium]|nr:carbon-nitrogen hydrolase family protein [Betaproteobacteria bacterium]
MTTFRAACVQLNSGNDLAANLRAAGGGVRAAAERGAQLIMLPEYAALLDGSGRVMRDNSYAEDRHPALPAFQALAQETRAWLLPGSITVKIE